MNYPWLHDYLAAKQGATRDFKEEWQWTRYQIGGKLFAAVCRDDDGAESIVTLKLPPEDGRFFRAQYEDIFPGYYMNKEHWNSVRLDGSVPDDLLQKLLDKSYELVFSSLPKKRQRELAGQEG